MVKYSRTGQKLRWGGGGTILFLLFTVFLASPAGAFDLSQFSFTVQPKIPTDNGSLSDYGIGYRFTDRIASEVRLSIVEKKTNEKFSGIENSLNAVDRSEWKWFFMPLQFSFINSPDTGFSVGLGLYYYRQTLDENGYFQMASLATPVNAYTNHYFMSLMGPAAETDFSFAFDSVKIAVNAGVVPIAFFTANQTVDIIPLFTFSNFEHDQSNTSAFSLYGKLTVGLFDLVDINGVYNGSFLTSDIIDFDTDYNVFASEKKSYTQSIQVEGILNLQFADFNMNIGIGGAFNAVYLDSVLSTEGKRLYFIVGAKKPFQ